MMIVFLLLFAIPLLVLNCFSFFKATEEPSYGLSRTLAWIMFALNVLGAFCMFLFFIYMLSKLMFRCTYYAY